MLHDVRGASNGAGGHGSDASCGEGESGTGGEGFWRREHLREDVARVPERLGLHLHQKLELRLVWPRHDVIEEDGRDGEVLEAAEVPRRQHRLLRLHRTAGFRAFLCSCYTRRIS